MPRHKKGRVSVHIDMTPMVDVVMLLLTFFMMTTQFRPPEEVAVEVPASHSMAKVPEGKVITIYVNKEGNIYMGVDSQVIMARIFGEENRLKREIEVTKETLPNLLIQARIANPGLFTVIKGDKHAPYGPMEDVMSILQKVNITRFNLVTDLDKGA
ncbi:MAG: biopolymer transporter ExbD [Bacteroidetes bacterium]|nr:biopolymer transporter ExbD [Bacteroidota bacterium]